MLFRACAYCDHPNPVGTNFCNDCGAALHLQPCRQCGAVSVIKARHCPSCKSPFPERPLIDVSIPWAGEPSMQPVSPARSLAPPGLGPMLPTDRASINPMSPRRRSGDDGSVPPGLPSGPGERPGQPATPLRRSQTPHRGTPLRPDAPLHPGAPIRPGTSLRPGAPVHRDLPIQPQDMSGKADSTEGGLPGGQPDPSQPAPRMPALPRRPDSRDPTTPSLDDDPADLPTVPPTAVPLPPAAVGSPRPTVPPPRPNTEAAAFTRRLLEKASQSNLLGDDPQANPREELIIPAPSARPRPTHPASPAPAPEPEARGELVPLATGSPHIDGLIPPPPYSAVITGAIGARPGAQGPRQTSAVSGARSAGRWALVLAAVLATAGLGWWAIEQELLPGLELPGRSTQTPMPLPARGTAGGSAVDPAVDPATRRAPGVGTTDRAAEPAAPIGEPGRSLGPTSGPSAATSAGPSTGPSASPSPGPSAGPTQASPGPDDAAATTAASSRSGRTESLPADASGSPPSVAPAASVTLTSTAPADDGCQPALRALGLCDSPTPSKAARP